MAGRAASRRAELRASPRERVPEAGSAVSIAATPPESRWIRTLARARQHVIIDPPAERSICRQQLLGIDDPAAKQTSKGAIGARGRRILRIRGHGTAEHEQQDRR